MAPETDRVNNGEDRGQISTAGKVEGRRVRKSTLDRSTELIIEQGRCYWKDKAHKVLTIHVYTNSLMDCHWLMEHFNGGRYPHPYRNPTRWRWSVTKREDLLTVWEEVLRVTDGEMPDNLQRLVSYVDAVCKGQRQ
jgi:hypothetical protein